MLDISVKKFKTFCVILTLMRLMLVIVIVVDSIKVKFHNLPGLFNIGMDAGQSVDPISEYLSLATLGIYL